MYSVRMYLYIIRAIHFLLTLLQIYLFFRSQLKHCVLFFEIPNPHASLVLEAVRHVVGPVSGKERVPDFVDEVLGHGRRQVLACICGPEEHR